MMAENPPVPSTPFFCSWSGGKDCALALHLAMARGARPRQLITLLIEDGQRTRSHGLRREVIEAQARAMDVPLITRSASWADYEQTMITVLRDVRRSGTRAGVFGDMDIDRHRAWEERVCAEAEMTAYLPLWKWDRRVVLDRLLADRFEAMIVAVNAELLGPDFLGRIITPETIEALTVAGADACGENGEFHTVVTNGPFFHRPIHLQTGETVQRSGYWFLDVNVAA